MRQLGQADRPARVENLLCRNCEGNISRYETYTRKIFFENAPAAQVKKQSRWIIDPSTTPQMGRNRPLEVRLVSSGDYRLFKLFQISLLWRAAVAGDSFYERCRLDEVSEDFLREALLKEEPPDPEHFSCEILDLQYPGLNLTKWIDTPRRLKTEGRDIIFFVLAGYGWIFWINPRPVPNKIARDCLKKNGNFSVQVVDAAPALEWWAKNKA